MTKRQIKNTLTIIFQKAILFKPSHTPKNVFQYLMDDVNEWSTEYNVKVGSFSVLPESPHSWDKKVLNLSPLKKDGNYRFRVGLQMFRMTTNKEYSLVVELYKMYQRCTIVQMYQTFSFSKTSARRRTSDLR